MLPINETEGNGSWLLGNHNFEKKKKISSLKKIMSCSILPFQIACPNAIFRILLVFLNISIYAYH